MSTTKTPIRTVYDGLGAAVGLAEYQSGEVVGIEHGGTGGNTVAEAKLALTLTDSNIRSLISVSGGGSYDNTTGIVTINATDLTPYAKTASLTTANVTELTNLYYTTDRANTAIDNRVTKAFVDALGIDATTLDGIDSLPFAKDADLTTANVSELTNLYFTNARVYSNVTAIGYATNTNVALKANVVDLTAANIIGLTTANVAEVTNLYYTDARVQSNVVTYLTGEAVKTISGNLNITGNLNIAGAITTFTSNVVEIQDPMIYLGTGNSGDVNDIGIVGHFTNPSYQHTGFVRDASDGVWKLFANVATEPTNNTLDFTNATYSTIKVGDIQSATGTFTGNVATGNISATRAIVTYSDLGTVTSGTWNGTSISTTYTDAKVATVAGVTSATISNAQLLAGLLTVDGVGSGLDADLLDGSSSSFYLDVSNMSSGILAVARGGTGVATSTGSGNVVLSNSPTFTGTINAAEISATGNVTSPYFYSQSDINLKKDLVRITDALDIVKLLDGYRFKWKNNDADSIGLIAQYVEAVLPMLIGTAPDGSKTVLYNGIIAILLEAIKAQQVQIDEIKAQLNG